MDNFKIATDATTSAINSQGSAMNENQKYIDSIQGRMGTLGATIEEKWDNAISSDSIKGTVSALTVLIDTFGNIPSVIGLATTAFLAFKGKAIGESVSALVKYQMALGATSVGEAVLSGATNTVSLALNSLKVAIVTNPLGALAVAITTLIAAFAFFQSSADASTEKLKQFNQETEQAVKNNNDQSKSLNELSQAYSDHLFALQYATEGTEKYDSAKQQLNQTYDELKKLLPSLPDQIDLESKSYAEQKNIIDGLIKSKQLQMDQENATKATDYLKKNNLGQESIDEQARQLEGLEKYLDELNKKKNQGIKFDDTGLDIDVRIDQVNKHIKEYRDTLTPLMTLIPAYNKLYPEQAISIDKAINALTMLTDATNKNMNAEEKAKKVAEDNAKAREQASSSFETATTNIDFYNKALSELDKDGVLSSSTVKDILNNHQELIGSLGSEATLRQRLSVLVKEQENAQQTAYKNMLANSEQYYNENIRGNTEMQNKINTVLSSLVDSQGKAYSIDLDNFSTLSQAKLEMTKQIVKSIAGAWADFWDSQSNDFSSEFYDTEMGDRVSGTLVSNRFNTASKMGDEIRAKLSEIDKITFTPIKLNFSSINNNQPSSGSGSDSDKKDPNDPSNVQNLELKIDRYQNLNAAIDNVNNALARNKTLQDQANDRDRLNLLNEEISLLNQKRTALNNLLAEQQREKNELESQLRNAGFVVDSVTGLINNYQSRLQALQNSANASTSKDAKQLAIDSVKKIEEAIKTYMDLVHKTMASTKNDILSIDTEIKKIYEDQLSVISDVESKITEVIKKQVEERKQAIEDEKTAKIKAIQEAQDAYNKANSTDDYQENLSNEQQKLSEIQSQIADASRDKTLQGKARLKSLMDEAKAQQDVIDKMVLDHQRELNNQAFEDQKQAIEDDAEAKTKNLEDTYTDEKVSQIVKQALNTGYFQDINGKMTSVKDAYIDFENRFGEGMTALGDKIKSDFISKLDEARQVMTSLGTVMNNLGISHINDVNSGIFDNVSGLLNNVNLNLPQITPNITVPIPSLSSSTTNQTPSIVFNEPFMVIQGNVDDSTMPKLQQSINDAIEKFKQSLTSQLQLQGIY